MLLFQNLDTFVHTYLCKEIKAKVDYLKFKDIGESLFQNYNKYELSHILLTVTQF